MSWLCNEGFQGSSRGDISDMYPWMHCNVEAGIMTVDPQDAINVFYNDMGRQEAEYWVSKYTSFPLSSQINLSLGQNLS
jgi:hypothetical protein